MSHDYAMKPQDVKKIESKAKYCSGKGCTNSTLNKPALAFFAFPARPKRLLLWKHKCIKDKFKTKDLDFIRKNCFLCADHFDASQFVGSFRNKLVPLAVPNDPDLKDAVAQQRKRANDAVSIEDYAKQARLVNDSDVVNGTNVALKEVLQGITKQLGLPPNTKIVYSTTGQTSGQMAGKKTQKILLIKRAEKVVMPKTTANTPFPVALSAASTTSTTATIISDTMTSDIATTTATPTVTTTSATTVTTTVATTVASVPTTAVTTTTGTNLLPLVGSRDTILGRCLLASSASTPTTISQPVTASSLTGSFILTPPLATSGTQPRLIHISNIPSQNPLLPRSNVPPSIIRLAGQSGTQPIFRLIPAPANTKISDAARSPVKIAPAIPGLTLPNASGTNSVSLGKVITLAMPVTSSGGASTGNVLTLAIPVSSNLVSGSTVTTNNVMTTIPNTAALPGKVLAIRLPTPTPTITHSTITQPVRTYSKQKQVTGTDSLDKFMLPRIVSTTSIARQDFSTPCTSKVVPPCTSKLVPPYTSRVVPPCTSKVVPQPKFVSSNKCLNKSLPNSRSALTQTIPVLGKMDQLVQQNKEQKVTISALKRKINRLENRVIAMKLSKKEKVLTSRNVLDGARDMLSDTAYDIFRLLIQKGECGKKNTGTRYADCTKDFALCVYCCSKTAYRVCQSVFKLPSIKSILRKPKEKKDSTPVVDEEAVNSNTQEGGDLQIIHEDPDQVIEQQNNNENVDIDHATVVDPELQNQEAPDMDFAENFDEHAAAVTLIQTVSGQEMEIVENQM